MYKKVILQNEQRKTVRQVENKYLRDLDYYSTFTTEPLFVLRWNSAGSRDQETYVAYGVPLAETLDTCGNYYVKHAMHKMQTHMMPRLFLWSQLDLAALRRLLTCYKIMLKWLMPYGGSSVDVEKVTEVQAPHKFYTNDPQVLNDLLNMADIRAMQEEYNGLTAQSTVSNYVNALNERLAKAQQKAAWRRERNFDRNDFVRKEPTWQMYEITCTSFVNTFFLHRALIECNSPDIRLMHTWTLEQAIMLELFLRNGKFTAMYSSYLDAELRPIEMPCPKMPCFNTLAFDLECVTPNRNRVPLGDHSSDILFSASFTIVDGVEGVQIQETVFNLPIYSMTDAERQQIIRGMQLEESNMLDSENHFAVRTNCTLNRRIFIYNSERECLEHVARVFEQHGQRVTLLLGYNSSAFDMKFLLLRMALYNIPFPAQIDSKLFTLGTNYLHVDLMRTMFRFFQDIGSCTLKNASNKLLNRTKVDLDARQIRFIYGSMLKRQRIPRDGYVVEGITDPKKPITIAQLSLYNDVDSILVHELWYNLDLASLLFNISATYTIPMVAISTSASLAYLVNKFQVNALQRQTVMVQQKPNITARSSRVITSVNTKKMATGNAAKYSGGYNYRRAHKTYEKVYMLDMQAYYPTMMSEFNLSHESVVLITTNFYVQHLSMYPDSKWIQENFYIYHYSDQKHPDRLANLVSNDAYVDGTFANSELATHASIMAAHEAYATKQFNGDPMPRLLVISRRRRGIMSEIVGHRNIMREALKASYNKMCRLKKYVATRIDELKALPAAEQPPGVDEHTFNDMISVSFIASLDEEPLTNSKLNTDPELIAKLSLRQIVLYAEAVSGQAVLLNGQYRNMKLVNSSVYGLTGSERGLFSGIAVATAVTMLGRCHIVESAKIALQRYGYMLILSDTDSIFLTTTPESERLKSDPSMVARDMLAINPGLILCHEVYESVFVIAKKTYMCLKDGGFMSRGLTKNGPTLWLYYMEYFFRNYLCKSAGFNVNFDRNNIKLPPTSIQMSEPIEMKNNSDLYKVLVNMYQDTYNLVTRHRNLLLMRINVRSHGEYKTRTPVRCLMDRILTDSPGTVFGKTLQVFYRMNVLKTCNTPDLGIEYELEKLSLTNLNLFKFYDKMQKCYYEILSKSLMTSDEFIRQQINYKTFSSINKQAFLDVRARHLEENKVTT